MTVGHSTRTLCELVTLLESNGVRHLIDVRSSPTSRRWPHFNQKPFADALHANGIRYSHLPELGGRRNRGPTGNTNAGWSEPGFRNYADYMQTAEFERGVALLVHAAALECVAIMCSEAVWWRCHRRLIADALLVRGIQVRHILSERSVQLARLTPFAVVNGTSITYPVQPQAASSVS